MVREAICADSSLFIDSLKYVFDLILV
ncbi:hypothetical protein CY0110_16422 [Crocosphaera chwakensis CCY0110]|uniref:Uncharacterized protein n=1 Tax=Crocosphaera chwakensis CCY0110 TaxID=391612 RepID=A3IHW6_9CHRO|nr:hypothetical protein CY0110_16422 [Crocosphaera chwakensis CCY0110]